MILDSLISNNVFTRNYVQRLDDFVITISKNNLLLTTMSNLINNKLLMFKLNIEMRYSYYLRTILIIELYSAQFWSVETNKFNII